MKLYTRVVVKYRSKTKQEEESTKINQLRVSLLTNVTQKWTLDIGKWTFKYCTLHQPLSNVAAIGRRLDAVLLSDPVGLF